MLGVTRKPRAAICSASHFSHTELCATDSSRWTRSESAAAAAGVDDVALASLAAFVVVAAMLAVSFGVHQAAVRLLASEGAMEGTAHRGGSAQSARNKGKEPS